MTSNVNKLLEKNISIEGTLSASSLIMAVATSHLLMLGELSSLANQIHKTMPTDDLKDSVMNTSCEKLAVVEGKVKDIFQTLISGVIPEPSMKEEVLNAFYADIEKIKS